MYFSYLLLLFLGVLPLISLGDKNNASCFPDYEEEKQTREDYWLQSPKRDYKGDILFAKRVKRDSVKKEEVPSEPGRLRYFSNYDTTLEAGINKQINIELYAHYTYLSLAYHFKRDDINMGGFYKFFLKMANEEHEHAQKFMEYQIKRGGVIRLQDIQKPCGDGSWGNGTMAMRKALELEYNVNQALMKLNRIGEKAKDAQFTDFLASNFLGEQVESMKELNDYVNTLTRLNDAVGEYHFDKMTLGGK